MITAAIVRRMLEYDPDTGIWVWIDPPKHNRRLLGKVAGTRHTDGSTIIRVCGSAYRSNRLAWLYMTGSWPIDEIDHEDRDNSNDRWVNLREATSSQNKFNSVRQSGLRGVYPCGKKWQVQVGGVYLGVFDDLEEAVIARDACALSMAGPFAILNNASQEPSK